MVAHARSGSNYLLSLLNSHKLIHIEGEEFNTIGKKDPKVIWSSIFKKRLPQVKICGFKIFYYHPRDSDDRLVWDIIKEDESIKLIHIYREDLLRSFVSLEIARQTNEWVKYSKKISIVEQIFLNITDFRQYSSDITKYQKAFLRSFTKHQIYEISYENLIQNRDDITNQILNFLNLPPKKLTSRMQPQNPFSIEEIVLNYEEVKTEVKRNFDI